MNSEQPQNNNGNDTTDNIDNMPRNVAGEMTLTERAINISNAIMNLLNSILGVGIITLPIAVKYGGIALGVTFSSLCCILIAYTSDLMVATAKKLEKNRGQSVTAYGELCKATLGPFSLYFLCSINFLMSFLTCCVYNIIFRKEIASVISDVTRKTFLYEDLVLVAVSFLVILPLCLLRKISKLGAASSLSILFVFLFVTIVLVRSPDYHRKMKTLTLEKTRQNELKLNTERTLYFCDSRNTAEVSRHIANYKSLAAHLSASKACPAIADYAAFNQSVAAFGAAVVAQPPVPSESWDAALAYVHSLKLFSTYSLLAEKPPGNVWLPLLSTLGVYASAYYCQQSTFSIFGQLRRKTVSEWRIVQAVTFSVVFVLCTAFAVAGFLAQGFQVGDTVFEKMKLRFYVDSGAVDWATNIARMLMIATIALSFPMQNYFARKNFIWFLFSLLEKITGKTFEKENPKAIYFYPVSLVLFGLALTIGLFVDEIIKVYSLMGSLFASPLIYIFPTLCYLRHEESIRKYAKDSIKSKQAKIIAFRVVIPAIVLLFGILITIISTTTTIMRFASK